MLYSIICGPSDALQIFYFTLLGCIWWCLFVKLVRCKSWSFSYWFQKLVCSSSSMSYVTVKRNTLDQRFLVTSYDLHCVALLLLLDKLDHRFRPCAWVQILIREHKRPAVILPLETLPYHHPQHSIVCGTQLALVACREGPRLTTICKSWSNQRIQYLYTCT